MATHARVVAVLYYTQSTQVAGFHMAHRGDATRKMCRIWGKTAGVVAASLAIRSV